MSENIQRTIYGGKLQTATYLRLPFELDQIATLNSKFNILPDALPANNVYPAMRYFSIGNGGHGMGVGADGISFPTTFSHTTEDSALFRHLPFILRPMGNDISPAERLKYALRRTEQWHGDYYIAYYLKRFDLTGASVSMNRTHVENGQSITTPFVPDSSNLNPVPRVLSSDSVNVVQGDFLFTSAEVDIVFDAAMVAELTAAAMIMYQNENLAILSEVALCSGVDKVVQITDPGHQPFNFNEAIAVQVCSFVQTFYSMRFNNMGFKVALDCGSTEPLFVVSSNNGVSP